MGISETLTAAPAQTVQSGALLPAAMNSRRCLVHSSLYVAMHEYVTTRAIVSSSTVASHLGRQQSLHLADKEREREVSNQG